MNSFILDCIHVNTTVNLQWTPPTLMITHTFNTAFIMSACIVHRHTPTDAHKQLQANYSLLDDFARCPLQWLPWPFPPEPLSFSALCLPAHHLGGLLAPCFDSVSTEPSPIIDQAKDFDQLNYFTQHSRLTGAGALSSANAILTAKAWMCNCWANEPDVFSVVIEEPPTWNTTRTQTFLCFSAFIIWNTFCSNSWGKPDVIQLTS